MKRPSRTGSKTKERKARDASPARARKATKAKRSSGSVPSNDLKDARAQQAATAEILKVIASSPSDVQPVFEAIASSAKRLLGGFSTTVYRIIGDVIHLVALTPTSTEADAAIKAEFPVKLS